MQNNIIEDCKKYMIVGNSMHTSQSIFNSNKNNIENKESKNINFQNKVNESNNSKMSLLQDTLFWCFFIILKGEQEYDLNHSFKREKEFKIESIEKLRMIKSELKAVKLRLNELEDELLNEKKITIKSLIALCLLYKINIMYIWKNKYIEMINNADEKINVIINEKNVNEILKDISIVKINYYRVNYWCIENISKPLKAIASYTRDELITIIEKLQIKDISAKKTKKEMYEKIIQNIS